MIVIYSNPMNAHVHFSGSKIPKKVTDNFHMNSIDLWLHRSREFENYLWEFFTERCSYKLTKPTGRQVCGFFLRNGLNYREAKDQCQRLGGVLPIIDNTKAVAEFLSATSVRNLLVEYHTYLLHSFNKNIFDQKLMLVQEPQRKLINWMSQNKHYSSD